MADHDEAPRDAGGGSPDVSERLALPLLVPVIVFLFAVLVIYGLSRIYLELNDIKIGTVTMATPLAIGVSLYILFSAWFLASNRRVPMWQTASLGMVAVVAITGGAIWAAVDDRGEDEHVENGGEPTPIVAVEEGQVLIGLTEADWVVSASPDSVPAGDITFVVTDEGTIPHNLRVIRTDLSPDALPLDDAGFAVDEDQVNVVAETGDLISGESEEVTETLEPGSYVLICNVPAHYGAGMFTAFTVQ